MAASRKALTLFDDYFDMMSDPVRNAAYRKAIEETVQSGDVVVDLGAGLGLLTLLAVRAGASRVYAIEKSDSIELARRVIERAGASDRVEFICGNSLEVELPERVDVLISETLGSAGFEENTLEFTIDARERFLKPGGRMVPSHVELWLAPVECDERRSRLEFWRDVEGFDFSPTGDEAASKMSLAQLEPEMLLAPPECVATVDLAAVSEARIELEHVFRFARRGMLHGLGGWFRARLSTAVELDTSPASPATHWKQAFFPFKDALRVGSSDILKLSFSLEPKADHSDNATVSYQYFCSQNEVSTGRPVQKKRDPCRCGSGRPYGRCCGRVPS